MMLFGCSSVAITAGKCEANGPAHSHLINGSPAVLGCLWEVTDKDTDKVT
jgi:separase